MQLSADVGEKIGWRFQCDLRTVFIAKVNANEPVTMIRELTQDVVQQLQLKRIWDDATWCQARPSDPLLLLEGLNAISIGVQRNLICFITVLVVAVRR